MKIKIEPITGAVRIFFWFVTFPVLILICWQLGYNVVPAGVLAWFLTLWLM